MIIMDITVYAKTLDTVSCFLGDRGVTITTPMLTKKMKKDGCLSVSYTMINGCRRSITLCLR